jgi:hypothetical protein
MQQAARILVLTATALIAAGGAAFTHHSVSGQFDTTKTVTVSGVITRIDWVNPHIYVFLDAKDQSGAVTQWALETLPTAMMRKAKLTKEAVAGTAGETVTIVGNPARDGRKSAWIHRITYADGRFLQLAN